MHRNGASRGTLKGLILMQTTVARRTERLIVRELGDETVVYDLDNDQVHCLTGPSAQVWRATGEPVSVRALCARSGLDEASAAAAVAQLGEKNLLVARVPAGASRRQLIQRGAMLGGAVVALPVIETMRAPAAMAAASNPPGYDVQAYFAGYAATHTTSGTVTTGTPP